MLFAQPLWLLTAAVILPLLYLRRRRGRVRVSSAAIHQPTWGSYAFMALPSIFLSAAILAGAATLAQPQRPTSDKSESITMGRDIMAALDYSGSMAAPFAGELPERDSKDPFIDGWGLPERPKSGLEIEGESAETEIRRIEAAQAAILSFVDRRRAAESGDAIGLIVFDDRPLLRWPLDRDLKQISRHGQFVPPGKGVQGLGNGTNFGTTEPGPIDMAADHFEKRGQSTTRVLILVTDGENELSDKVQARLESVISTARIKLYLIAVGEEIKEKELDIEKLCHRVGGKVFHVGKAGDLEKHFQEIDQLESSPVPVTTYGNFEPAFQLYLWLAIAFALAWGLSEAVISGR